MHARTLAAKTVPLRTTATAAWPCGYAFLITQIEGLAFSGYLAGHKNWGLLVSHFGSQNLNALAFFQLEFLVLKEL